MRVAICRGGRTGTLRSTATVSTLHWLVHAEDTMTKAIGVPEFRATCLRIMDVMSRDQQPVIVTKRGKPVALLSPIAAAVPSRSIFGAMAGTVLRFDEPFAPPSDPDEWNARRRGPSICR